MPHFSSGLSDFLSHSTSLRSVHAIITACHASPVADLSINTQRCDQCKPRLPSRRPVNQHTQLQSVQTTPPQSQTCQSTHSAAISASHASPVADLSINTHSCDQCKPRLPSRRHPGISGSHASPVADLSINKHRCDQCKPRLPSRRHPGISGSHASPVADLSINKHRCDQCKPRLPSRLPNT